MTTVEQMLGRKFHRWTVIKFAGRDKNRESKWECVCDCGNRKQVKGRSLRTGWSKSCGCLRLEAVLKANKARVYKTTHGKTSSKEYKIWSNMLNRCRNKKSASYKDYGGRGIRVHKRWQKFENFLEDMGEVPAANMSLDRIDNDGDYAPKNCKWSNSLEQANNRRNNIYVTVDGKTRSLSEWSRINKINCGTITSRVNSGWDLVRAVTTPSRPLHPRLKK